MLAQYLTNVQNLLQLPGAPSSLYSPASLTLWINIARGQIAGESESIRVLGTLPTQLGQRAYNFSSINIGTASQTGIQGISNVRNILYGVGTGMKWVKSKSWQWFLFYRMNNPVPPSGYPTEWAEFSQGSSGQGSITGVGAGTLASGGFYIDPLPDMIYTLTCDCVCYPQALAADTDVEALPYYWTDAVPYFAAYLALLSAQTGQRMQEAQQYFQLYQQFAQRARSFSNAATNIGMWDQSPDPMLTGRLGMKQQGAAGG